jgi:AcrR family transcriptional regulator
MSDSALTSATERTGSEEAAGHGPSGGPVLHPRGDTRARIQEIAVELFSEHGYEGTSLREIAERLGVTKAALYYHFKSKEDIVASLVDDYFAQVDDLVAWAQQQPRTAEVRAEILRRYLDMVADRHHVYRMLHQNQAALASLKSGEDSGKLFRARMNAIVSVLTDPQASLPERVRATAATATVSLCWMFFHDEVTDLDALRAAILGVADELAQPPRDTPAAT